MHSTNTSCKHLIQHKQFRFSVKKEFVATNGCSELPACSQFTASTRHVAQLPSSFSTRNTVDLVSSLKTFEIGFLMGHYNIHKDKT